MEGVVVTIDPRFFVWWRHRLKKNNPVIWALCLLGCSSDDHHLPTLLAFTQAADDAVLPLDTIGPILFGKPKTFQTRIVGATRVTHFSLYRNFEACRFIDQTNKPTRSFFFWFSFVVIYLLNKNSHFRIRCNRNKLEPQGVYRSNRNSSPSCEWT